MGNIFGRTFFSKFEFRAAPSYFALLLFDLGFPLLCLLLRSPALSKLSFTLLLCGFSAGDGVCGPASACGWSLQLRRQSKTPSQPAPLSCGELGEGPGAPLCRSECQFDRAARGAHFGGDFADRDWLRLVCSWRLHKINANPAPPLKRNPEGKVGSKLFLIGVHGLESRVCVLLFIKYLGAKFEIFSLCSIRWQRALSY